MYQGAAQQYQNVNNTSEVLDADPHRLIQLLMEAMLTRLAQAKFAIENNDMENKANLLGRVWDILSTLQGSLDVEKGGEVAENLERMYEYMSNRLFEASSENNPEIISEVIKLMLTVKEGWDGIREEYLNAAGEVASA